MKWHSVLIMLVVVVSCLYDQSFAQDNHYAWTQYGSRNSILYNANMSRFEDQSAVIVNPATLAEAQQSSFNFNTNAVGFSTIKFKNGLGEGFTITSSNINVFPAMASGVIKPKASRGDWVLGYSIYSKNTDALNFSDRSESVLDIIDEGESPGPEHYIAQYNVNTSVNEDALVAGIGWHTKNNLAVGLSQTFIYTSQEYSQIYSAYAIPDPGAGASIDLAGTNYNYHTDFYKLITNTKLGFILKLKRWDFGLTLAAPTLGIFGKGYMLADLNLINIRTDVNLAIPRKNFVANGEFDKLPVKYKYPFQAVVGISRPFGKVRVYGSLAWHSYLKAYNILDPGDVSFVQPPSDQNVLYTSQALALWTINQTVFNGALAADWLVRENYHFLFSFRTDYHYGDIDPEHGGFNAAVKQWNNYHFTLGTQRIIGSSEWVIGLQYIFARRNDYPQPISFTNPAEDNFFQGVRSTGTVTSQGLELLLSYTFTFGGPPKAQ